MIFLNTDNCTIEINELKINANIKHSVLDQMLNSSEEAFFQDLREIILTAKKKGISLTINFIK